MLQRIYGTAQADKKQLNAYLQRLEEAAKRDHRKIGKQLDLYHMQEEAPGMVFWHNDGWTIFRELEAFVRMKLKEYQYRGSERSVHDGPRAVGKNRPLGKLQRRHVHHRVGKPRILHQADELPGARADLQPGA